jgi:hypothetical protein
MQDIVEHAPDLIILLCLFCGVEVLHYVSLRPDF